MGNLIRALGRMCEALLPHLRAGRAAYIVGGVAPAAARAAMWLVNDVQEFNVLGVERMVRGRSHMSVCYSSATCCPPATFYVVPADHSLSFGHSFVQTSL